MSVKVLVYPKAENPYQDLLYEKLIHDKDVTVTYFRLFHLSRIYINIFLFPIDLIIKRFQGFTVFHLHWLYEFQVYYVDSLFIKLFFTIYVIALFILVRLSGFKLIWTIHDFQTHDKQFIDDLLVTRVLSVLCNVQIIHSEETRHLLKANGMRTDNIKYMPIGGYIDYYPNVISSNTARLDIGLEPTDFVFTFFGRIEKYKGVIELLDAFKDLHLPRAKLLIAGPCNNNELNQQINKNSDRDSIIIKNNYIPDKDIQIIMNASDVIVCPFLYITNSSTALLAGTFGKPVIAPLIGSLKDLPRNIGYFYIPGQKNLKNAMLNAYGNRQSTKERGGHAYKYISSISWKVIGESLRQIYLSV